MKKLKISLLTMAVVAGGAIGASAATAKTTEGDTFTVDLVFPSNAPLSFVSVSDIPQGAKALTISNVEANVSVNTDGSGKIEGAGFLRISYGIPSISVDTNTTPPTTNISFALTAFSDYIVDVSGKISTKNNNPNIQESIKGKGYSTTGSNISIINAQAASSSFSVSFTGNSAVSSNGTTAGNLKGSINPGKVTAINGGKTIKVDETAILNVDNIQITDLPVTVVAFGGKFDAVAFAGGDGAFRGSGSSSNGKFNSNFKGVGNARGSSFKITGATAPVAIITDVTNNVTFVSQGELKGKILGQTVDVKGLTTTSGGF